MAEFEALDTLLQKASAVADAAESHGFLCGVLCAAGHMDPAAWLPHLMGEADWDSHAVQECGKALGLLSQELRKQINSPELDFTLLLPDDDLPLQERAASLGAWAQGLLTGLGLGGLDKDQELSEDSRDYLNDISEISQVEFDFRGGSEEDEQAYAEIVEYLRMGALMLYEELQPLEAPPRLQ